MTTTYGYSINYMLCALCERGTKRRISRPYHSDSDRPDGNKLQRPLCEDCVEAIAELAKQGELHERREESPLYYIQDTRAVVGDCALFWRENGAGYTCDLNDAGLYTEEKIPRSRKTDVPHSAHRVRPLAVLHVGIDVLRQLARGEDPNG